VIAEVETSLSHLGLSRPSRAILCLHAGGLGLKHIVSDVGRQSFSLGHAAERLASTRRLSLLLVRGEVEQDEENQVGADDNNSSQGSELLSGALAIAGHPREVCRNEVSVGCKVDEADVDDELDDLQTCDPLFPPDANTPSALEIVPVHDNMDHQVQSDGDPGHRGVANQLAVAQNGRCTVVVAVEECQGLLLEEQEYGVEEFEVLGQVGQLA
jgi:hypothetical protein